jgi:DNA-binding NarL/FixJ family response regulator
MVDGNGGVDLFVVEDNKLVRLAVTKLISNVRDFRVVGSAEDGGTAIREIVAKRPQIAIVDIGLPDLDGIEVTRQIKAKLPELKVIMLTASDNDGHVIEALNAGADGYVLKDVFGDRLEMAIRSVRIGAVWLDPAIAKRLLIRAREGLGHDKHVGTPALSPEDVDLLGAVADSQCADGVCMVEPQFLKKLHDSLSLDSPDSNDNVL